MKNRLSEIDSQTVWVVFVVLAMTLAYTWFMVAIGFNKSIQDIFYPYSRYPVVVHTAGEIIMLPCLVLMWLGLIGGINHILLNLFDNQLFKVFKQKLTLLLVGVMLISIIMFILDIIVWPIVAKENGYSPCPYDTLLFGKKISTAWSKKEAFCYDKGVQSRLSTGTFEQVVQVAKYLDSKHLDKKD